MKKKYARYCRNVTRAGSLFLLLISGMLIAAGCESPTGGGPNLPAEYAITAAQSANGTFTVKADGTDVTSAAAGTSITLTATAAEGYQFKQWTVTGVTLASNTTNPATFTMPGAAVTVTAEFEAIPEGMFAITATQPVNGTFTVKADSVDVTKATAGTSITLAATPAEGYQFKQWTVTGATLSSATTSPATFTMPGAAVTVTAEFEVIPEGMFAITATQPPNGGTFTVKADGTDVTSAAAETTITLTATPTNGYQFKQWTVTGATLSSATTSPATFTMPSAAVTVAAEFEVIPEGKPAGTASVTLTASEKWSGTLEVQGGGSSSIARRSGTLTISVTGGSFTSFVWIVDGTVVTGSTTSSITLTGLHYSLGGHFVTVYAQDTDDIPWSPPAPIAFTVTAD
jgi:uncharacterized repeat protein (TIGR02543 family)